MTAKIVATGIGLSADTSDNALRVTIDTALKRGVIAFVVCGVFAVACFNFPPLRRVLDTIPDALLGDGQGPSVSFGLILFIMLPPIAGGVVGRLFSVTLQGTQEQIADAISWADQRANVPAAIRWITSVDVIREPDMSTENNTELFAVMSPPRAYAFVALLSLIVGVVGFTINSIAGS